MRYLEEEIPIIEESVTTEADNATKYIEVQWTEDGISHGTYYPCHCGTTHYGPYALTDYAMHNCLHRVRLIKVTEELGDYFMCPSCGQTFNLDLEIDNGS